MIMMIMLMNWCEGDDGNNNYVDEIWLDLNDIQLKWLES